MDTLQVIKRLAIRRRIRFTEKAREEMEFDGLTMEDIVESIVNARKIDKTIRSRSPLRSHAYEKLFVIKSTNYEGTLIYTKGALRSGHGGAQGGEQVFYILISAKISDRA